VEDALAQVGLEKVAGRLASQVVVVLVLGRGPRGDVPVAAAEPARVGRSRDAGLVVLRLAVDDHRRAGALPRPAHRDRLLLGLPGNRAMDFAALLGATVAGITAASLLLGRLAR
jgi:hypothetical protein